MPPSASVLSHLMHDTLEHLGPEQCKGVEIVVVLCVLFQHIHPYPHHVLPIMAHVSVVLRGNRLAHVPLDDISMFVAAPHIRCPTLPQVYEYPPRQRLYGSLLPMTYCAPACLAASSSYMAHGIAGASRAVCVLLSTML